VRLDERRQSFKGITLMLYDAKLFEPLIEISSSDYGGGILLMKFLEAYEKI
jgi:hypothetical protein